ncbi:DUF1045 domain-containing protein [Alsobacter sp. R-9]
MASPALQSPGLTAVAAGCVLPLQPFRAPLSPDDRAWRRPERLDDVGRRYLDRYGYPYVLDRFRFHMTLSGSLDDARREPTRRSLAAVLSLNSFKYRSSAARHSAMKRVKDGAALVSWIPRRPT